jgi:hypothetical protein
MATGAGAPGRKVAAQDWIIPENSAGLIRLSLTCGNVLPMRASDAAVGFCLTA